MRFGSLFSGIGGIDLGLERAGMECAFQVENEPYCLKVLAKHWPNVTRYEDIREVDFARVEPVELLAGGFPCQDLSYAGKGAGLSGERSGLWGEFVRAIRVVRPRYVLVENVPGLLSRGMGVVLGDLSALRYDAEWESIPAAAFGAPHLRWRVFIVAYAAYGRGRAQVSRGCPEGHSETPPTSLCADVAHASQLLRNGGNDNPRGHSQSSSTIPEPGNGSSASDVGDSYIFSPQRQRASRLEVSPTRYTKAQPESSGDGAREHWATEPDVGRVAHGVPRRVDKLRGLGNAVVPQKAEWLGRLILEHEAA